MKRQMRRWGALLGLAVAAWWPAPPAQAGDDRPMKLGTTADHARFEPLQRTFASGPEVTKACLGCHTEASRQIHRTRHWAWDLRHPDTGQRLGKRTLVNNFCIAIASNQSSCTSCHIGYGWKDDQFDFASQENVDCLVCHDTTGAYRKAPGLAGHVVTQDTELPPGSGKVVKAVDLAKVAQKVGKTSRDTCGACHFFGGGGDGVKHGDMDSSLSAPDHEVDVHMDATGLDFTCATCHAGSGHDVVGSRYTPAAVDAKGARMHGRPNDGPRATCASCHGNAPHKAEERLNAHARTLACQTCHIPSYARGGVATKLSWDWSTAGQRDENGKPIVRKDEKGRIVYESRKGNFTLGEDVKPSYAWFNGDVRYTLVTDRIEKTDRPTPINTLGGAPGDGKSVIWPVKVFRGVQPWDPVNRTLITPHTAGNDNTGFWKNLDWAKAIPVGMDDAGVPYSGRYEFIRTEMSWPLTHMVAPKEKALGCVECHARDGRLAGIQGVYLPGRDRHGWVDVAGWSLVLLTLLGVLGHAALRIVNHRPARSRP